MKTDKATLTKLNKSGQEVKNSEVEVLFNPKELTFSKTNNWNQDDSPKANVPAVEFKSGGPTTLKLQLYFDTYRNSSNGTCADVKDFTSKVCEMMVVDPELQDKKNKKGRPPTVRFHWGSFTFDGVISSINQRFTLFLPGGTPVRAVLDVSLSEIKDKQDSHKTNPTSGGVGGERIWTVREGDTLPWIAFSEYNDATEWRIIADANQLSHVRRLRPGMRLLIPSV